MSLNTPNKHLSYFKVENFKRFKSLELKDIGQFNIIVGDNNTGKTSLLEALLIENKSITSWESTDVSESAFSLIGERLKQRVKRLQGLKVFKQQLLQESDIYKYFVSDSTSNDSKILFHLGFSPEDINLPKTTHSISFKGSNLSHNKEYIPFIGFGNFYDSTFEKKYAKHIQTSVSQKNKFTQRLKAFINNISYLDMSLDENRDMKLLIAESHKDATTEIGKFGEGSLKLARILVDTMVYAGERLMIDEVEAGVHWSRFQIFWKTILLSAIENNTQLFMTTHDAECLQYLINAVDETPELASVKDKFRLIELRERTTDNDIAPIIHNYEALHYFLENGREVRGGHIVK